MIYRMSRTQKVRLPLLCVAIALTVCGGRGSAGRAGPLATPATDLPVRIEHCDVLSREVLQDPFNALPRNYVNGVAVRFANLRSTNATSVTLRLRYEGTTESVSLHGSYAANVAVDHTFGNFDGMISGNAKAVCELAAVTFADGATWAANP